MEAIVTLVHIIGAILLIILVLLQQGKGSGMGSAFGGGGGAQTTFGTSGGSVFGKATAVAAVVFMLTSLSLAYMSGRGTTSLMRGPAPVEEGAAPLPPLEEMPAPSPDADPAPDVAPEEAPQETE